MGSGGIGLQIGKVHWSDEIRLVGFKLLEVVEELTCRARQFYYAVALVGRSCSNCRGELEMCGESRCRCTHCQMTIDPTVAFQRCLHCGGTPVLRIRRYACAVCGADVASRYVFDGLVFDAEYFRQKTIEYRQRKHEIRTRVCESLLGTRSDRADVEPISLLRMNGLLETLDGLTFEDNTLLEHSPVARFDLPRYQSHIQAHTGPITLTLNEIPPLSEDTRMDRIWRFVAIVFLANAGMLNIWQEGSDVMVNQHETD